MIKVFNEFQVKNIYITTDWHLNHKNIVIYDNRPENFKEIIASNFQIIEDDDLLINLGDVIFNARHELKPFMDNIKGKKILIMGNHDRNTATWYSQQGFDKVFQKFVFNQIVFSHKPVKLGDYPGCKLNIHGHFHEYKEGLNTQYDFYSDKNICLTISEMKYKPILLKDFLEKRDIKMSWLYE
jgi:calcineurin-like phosphoesterase family protein